MNKKAISTTLRAARDLMNDGGKHWVKKFFSRRVKGGEKAYCSIGSVQQVLGAKKGAYVTAETRPALVALANAIRFDKGLKTPLPLDAPKSTILYTIWSWNDQKSRTWKDVKRVFTAAAKDPVVPEPKVKAKKPKKAA